MDTDGQDDYDIPPHTHTLKTTKTEKTRKGSIGHGCPHFRFFGTERKSHNDYSG